MVDTSQSSTFMSDEKDDDKTIVSMPAPWQSQSIAVARHCPKCGLEVSNNTMVCPVDNTAIFEAPGKVLADSYEFISVSGWGGMSVIYKARQRETGHIVAIKMLHSLLVSDQALRRFEQEAKAIMSLRHPNIITVHDFGVSEHGQPYMVMDFIEGKTLADVIAESGGLSLEESLPRFIQLCDALDHAHAVGVLHRDLKPSNVMISNAAGNFEDARIVDFGIAKLLDKEGENKDIGHLTQTGELFGSPLYMSPEQCRGTRVDERTDIYSMGCVMYETLTGKPPFRGATIVDTLMMQMSATPDSLSDASGKRFSTEVEDVIAKALAKAPDDRYQTMQQLEMALMSIQPNRQSNSQPLRVGKTKKQTAIPSFVYGAVIAFAFVAVVFFAWWQAHKSRQPVSSKESVEERNSIRAKLIQSQKQQGLISESVQKLLQQDHGAIDDQVLREACSNGDLQIPELDLNRAAIGDVGTKYLSSQTSLKKLYLDHTQAANGTISVIAHLPNIEKVSMRDAKFSDFAFNNQPVMPHLWGLYLSGARGVGDTSLNYITLQPNLKDLDVTGSAITDEGFRLLHRTNLVKLWASDTKFGDQAIHSLQHTDHLTDLYIGDTKVTDAGFAQLKAPALKELDISSTGVTDKEMHCLTKFPHLDSLRLVWLPITDSGAEVFKNLKDLRRLNLDSTKVTDKTIRIISKLPELRELNLSKLSGVSDAGIEALSHAKSLEQLNLTLTKVTDVGLNHLKNLKTLKTLILTDCPNLTLDAIRQFKRNRSDCAVYAIESTGTF